MRVIHQAHAHHACLTASLVCGSRPQPGAGASLGRPRSRALHRLHQTTLTLAPQHECVSRRDGIRAKRKRPWREAGMSHLKPQFTPQDERAWREYLDAFHLALPFTESERIWMVYRGDAETSDLLRNRESDALVSAIADDELELHSAGIQVTHDGRAVTERWWDWRRQRGQFEGQDSLLEVKIALNGVVSILTPSLDDGSST